MSRIAITGSSGLVGRALVPHLIALGHEVRPIKHGKPGAPGVDWSPRFGWIREGAFDGVDVIVHLAGASIGDGRWSDERKKELRDSRVATTRLLVDHLAGLAHKPRTLVAASAVGYYGNGVDAPLTEESPTGEGFLANLTAAWENETFRAQELGIRTVALRFGVVLSTEGGAFPKLLKPFRLGMGGSLGNGRQWMSWISLDDAVAAITHALDHDLSGPYNAVAPNPVTNREFTAALSKTLGRPAILPVPAMALRLVVGEAAQELLLWGQRADSGRLQRSGFHFDHPEVHSALSAILSERKAA